MVNYQQPEYVMDNNLICFGLSTQETEEFKPSWTPLAEKELAIVKPFNNNQFLKINLCIIGKELVQEKWNSERFD